MIITVDSNVLLSIFIKQKICLPLTGVIANCETQQQLIPGPSPSIFTP